MSNQLKSVFALIFRLQHKISARKYIPNSRSQIEICVKKKEGVYLEVGYGILAPIFRFFVLMTLKLWFLARNNFVTKRISVQIFLSPKKINLKEFQVITFFAQKIYFDSYEFLISEMLSNKLGQRQSQTQFLIAFWVQKR